MTATLQAKALGDISNNANVNPKTLSKKQRKAAKKKAKKQAARSSQLSSNEEDKTATLPPAPPMPPTPPTAEQEKQNAPNSTGVETSTPTPTKETEPIVPFPPTPPPGNQQAEEPTAKNNDKDEVVEDMKEDVKEVVKEEVKEDTKEGVKEVIEEVVVAVETALDVVEEVAAPVEEVAVFSPVKEAVKGVVNETADTPVQARTPMSHINLGSLSVSEETKVEISTPNERDVVNMLTKKMGLPMAEIEETEVGEEQEKEVKKQSNEMFSEWSAYDAVACNDTSQPGIEMDLKVTQWACTTCTFINTKEHANVCEVCGVARKSDTGCETIVRTSRNSCALKRTDVWNCKACSYENTDDDSLTCEMCSTEREKEDGFALTMEMNDTSFTVPDKKRLRREKEEREAAKPSLLSKLLKKFGWFQPKAEEEEDEEE